MRPPRNYELLPIGPIGRSHGVGAHSGRVVQVTPLPVLTACLHLAHVVQTPFFFLPMTSRSGLRRAGGLTFLINSS